MTILRLSKNLSITNLKWTKQSICSMSTITSITNQWPESVAGNLIGAKSFNELPKVPAVPFLGSMWIFMPYIGKYNLRRMNIAHLDFYKKYGPIVRLDFGPGRSGVFIYDPRDIETMYRNEGKYPVREFLDSFKMYRRMNPQWYNEGGLGVANGPKWHEFRTKVQQYLLRPNLIGQYLPAMNVVANEMVNTMNRKRDINSGEIDNLLNELYKWALESVSLVALDAKLGLLSRTLSPTDPAQIMIKNANKIFDYMWQIDFESIPIWRWIDRPFGKLWKEYIKSSDEFTKCSMQYIKEAMKRIENDEQINDKPSVLQILLAREDFSQIDAVTMALDLLIAGIDTTSHTISFLMYHLAKNPEAQERLRQEVDHVVGDSKEITISMLNKMQYLKACFKESLRITPTVQGTARTLDHDVVLSGYRVPAGTYCLPVNYLPARNEKYFPDALKYIPERWLKAEQMNELHPFLVIPFGFGPRMCIGRRIAQQEIWTLITKLMQNYKIEYHHEDIGIVTRIVNMPDKPLKFKFIHRY